MRKKTGTYGILGITADESRLRAATWIKNGCNEFDCKRVLSKPLSIWTENDIWTMIDQHSIPIAEIYNKGAQRTGCMLCGFGCQFKDDNRLEMLLRLYPRAYTMAMNYINNGVTYREALRTVLAVNGLYLPDEQPKTLFDI